MKRKITIWGFEFYDQKGVLVGAQVGHSGPEFPSPEESKELQTLAEANEASQTPKL